MLIFVPHPITQAGKFLLIRPQGQGAPPTPARTTPDLWDELFAEHKRERPKPDLMAITREVARR
jgi:hypothetical protein